LNTRKVNPKTAREILPRWVKNWEDCAGKPYKKHKTSPGTIKETVKEAQDILARAGKCDATRWQIPIITIFELPFQYPQSLGELCLELAQDDIRHAICLRDFMFPLTGVYVNRRGIQELRIAMYH